MVQLKIFMVKNNQALINELSGQRVNLLKENIDSITLLRTVACLLIINSHCREIYPFYFFAVGGGHGNAIFFAVSGFCLASITKVFPQWYIRRVKRIIPPTFLMLLSGIVLDYYSGIQIQNVISWYLDRYWFVWAILLHYVVFYWVFSKQKINIAVIASMLYLVGYILLYTLFVDKSVFSIELEGFSPIKVYFYLGIFLAGGTYRLWLEQKSHTQRSNKRYMIYMESIVVLSCLLWCAEYALMMVMDRAYEYQFLIHLSIYVFSITVLVIMINPNGTILIPHNIVGEVIREIANATLEIYLVQVTFQEYLPKVAFPLNWIQFVSFSLLAGIVVHRISNWIIKKWRR